MGIKSFFIKPSTEAFYKEADKVAGYSWFDRLHGYVYGRWTFLYISIGTGQHPLAKTLGPILGMLPKRKNKSEAENRGTADEYHGKTIPLETATQLVMVNEPVNIPDLEHVIPYKQARALILQNPDDVRLFVSLGLAREDSIRLIRGSGVDTQRYAPALEPDGAPLVVLPARMLWDKGVGEFVAAARELRSCGVDARFALVGDADMENPASIPRRQLKEWTDEGVVEWWGQRDDMPNVFCQSALVCLPSYREGLPKALLEAASCGRAIVTSDVPGCREIVCHGDNGLLVPGRDAAALAAFLPYVDVLDFPDDAAPHYAEIRANLKKRGLPIGANDLFIAAHARSLGLTLVTNNTAEFGRVRGLRVENWTQRPRRVR